MDRLRETYREPITEVQRNLPIEHLGMPKGATQKLLEAGYRDAGDLLRATEEDLLRINQVSGRVCYHLEREPHLRLDLTTFPGIGEKTAENVRDAGYDTPDRLWREPLESVIELGGMNHRKTDRVFRVLDPEDTSTVYRDVGIRGSDEYPSSPDYLPAEYYEPAWDPAEDDETPLRDLPLKAATTYYWSRHLYPEDRDTSVCGREELRHGRVRGGKSSIVPVSEIEEALAPLEGDSPENICGHCWNGVQNNIEEMLSEDPSKELAGDVGYRMRWKQKGRAREEWYDIVLAPDATFEDLHSILTRFTTLFQFTHTCVYGLEDEYEDSSLGIVPADTYEVAPRRDTVPADGVTIEEIAGTEGLDEGDRLTMAHDRSMPDRYYGIVKDVFPVEEIDSRTVYPVKRAGGAALVDEKRPSE